MMFGMIAPPLIQTRARCSLSPSPVLLRWLFPAAAAERTHTTANERLTRAISWATCMCGPPLFRSHSNYQKISENVDTFRETRTYRTISVDHKHVRFVRQIYWTIHRRTHRFFFRRWSDRAECQFVFALNGGGLHFACLCERNTMWSVCYCI